MKLQYLQRLQRKGFNGLIDAKLQIYGAQSWAALAAIVPTTAHAIAEVVDDAGTHNDPVTDQIVANSGRFEFIAGDGNGWQRIGEATLDRAFTAISMAFKSPFQLNANFGGQLKRAQLTNFLIAVDLANLPAYNPAYFYSFATIEKTAQSLVLGLYPQTSPGQYVNPAQAQIEIRTDNYDPNSKDVLYIDGPGGIGRVAVVPAAIPIGSYSGMSYGIAGLDDAVFHKGRSLLLDIGGRKVVTADADSLAIQGGYASSIAYLHPNDATERAGDAFFQADGLGQYQVILADMAVQKIDTAFYSLYGAPFKGKLRVVRKTTLDDPSPNAGTLIEEINYPAAVYDDPLSVVLSRPALMRRGEYLAVYAIPDSGFKIGMRYWDHPRLGDPNPNGRTRLFFFAAGIWQTGGVQAGFAYWQVPLRLYTNIVPLEEFEALKAAGGGDVSELTERVNTGLDQEGFLRDRHLFGGKTIREFPRRRKLLMAIKAGSIAPIAGMSLVIAHAPADSYTADDLYVALEARAWKAEMGNGGPGWVGFGFPASADGADNATKSTIDYVQGNVDNAEVFPTFVSGLWTSGGYSNNEYSPDLCAAKSSEAGAQLNVTYRGAANIATVDLDYTVGAGTGVIEYRWNDEAGGNNAGAWTTLNLSGNGGAKAALANVPAGPWVLNIRVKAGSGVCTLNGCNLLTTIPGVVVHSLANNGSSLCGAWTFLLNNAQAAAKRAIHAASLSRLGRIDVFSCPIGTNDQNGYSTAQYETGMRAFINEQARVAGRLGCDIIWQIMPETRTTSGFTAMADFAEIAKKVADDQGIALILYQSFFGDAPAQYNLTGTHRKLIGIPPDDNLHPNIEGGFTIWYVRDRALSLGC